MKTLSEASMSKEQFRTFNQHDMTLAARDEASFEKTSQDANHVTFTLKIGRKIITWTYARGMVVRTLLVGDMLYRWEYLG